jgi:sterol 14-demethylase
MIPARFHWPLASRTAPGMSGRAGKSTARPLPFGAGRHRCVGAAFAMMQLKAIFSILLRRFEFELAQPASSYANDHSKMVVAVKQPCRVRFRRRAASAHAVAAADARSASAAAKPFRVCVDLDLCQGHAVCLAEAPEVFDLERSESGEDKVVLRMETPAAALRAKVEAAVQHCPTHALRIEE